MFHALLHGKLTEDIPAPERLEDALTSSVFGTLLLVRGSDVLCEWLSQARGVTGTLHRRPRKANHVQCWFWPQLGGVEPDVVVRLGRDIFIVEAKYRAGLHNGLPGQEASNSDEHAETGQLYRQWRRMRDLREGHAHGPADLCKAARGCEATFVLIVDQGRLAWAQRELRRCEQTSPRRTDLRVLTWQDLHRVLTTRMRRHQAQGWMEELARYLARVRLDGFAGLNLEGLAFENNLRFLRRWPRAQPGPPKLREVVHRLLGSGARLSAFVSGWSGIAGPIDRRTMSDTALKLTGPEWRRRFATIEQWQKRVTENRND